MKSRGILAPKNLKPCSHPPPWCAKCAIRHCVWCLAAWPEKPLLVRTWRTPKSLAPASSLGPIRQRRTGTDPTCATTVSSTPGDQLNPMLSPFPNAADLSFSKATTKDPRGFAGSLNHGPPHTAWFARCPLASCWSPTKQIRLGQPILGTASVPSARPLSIRAVKVH
jgi:hypothetical protein